MSTEASMPAEGVLRTMLLGRVKLAVVLSLVLGLSGAGAAMLWKQPAGPPPSTPPKRAKAENDGKDDKRRPRLDLHGGALPEGAVARLGSWRLRHRGPIFSFDISPDGKLLVSGGSADHMLRFWDVATGRELRRIETNGVNSVAFSPDGKTLASAGGNDGIRLRDATTGKVVRHFRGPDRAVTFSPDGKLLAGGGYDKLARLWDVRTGKVVRQFRGHEGAVFAVRFARGGKMLVSLGRDKTVRLWDATTGRELRQLKGHQDYVFGLAVAPDGKTLATGGQDKTVRLWDAATGKELRSWQAHEGGVSSIAFSPDGKLLASGGLDGRLRLWETATGKRLRQAEGLGVAGRFGVGQMHFFPDGKTLACVSDRVIRLLDVATLKERWPSDARQQGISSIAFAPDGKTLVTGLGDINYHSVSGGARLWVTATGKQLREFKGPPGPVFQVALTPDGKTLVGAGWESGVWLWDVATGKGRGRLRDGEGRFISIALSPDGKRLAGWERDEGVRVWDLVAKKVLCRIQAIMVCGLSPAAFSPDGRLLALGSGKDSITLYDTATGKPVRRITGEDYAPRSLLSALPPFHSVAFSPDGRTLASHGGHNIIRLWDPKTGRVLRRLLGHEGYVDAIAFSPDGRTLASGGVDGTIRLWEMATGMERRRFTGHQGRVTAVAFSPDGKLLASGSRGDTTGLLWDVTGLAGQVRGRLQKLGPRELDGLWKDLVGDDAARAFRAVNRLSATPGQAVPLLRKHLRAARPADDKHVARLIAALDGPHFAEREKAQRELERRGPRAVPALKQALAGKPPLEVRRRIEEMLQRAEDPLLHGESLRTVRAIEILENVGTPAARRILQSVAKGAPGAIETAEAAAALRRR